MLTAISRYIQDKRGNAALFFAIGSFPVIMMMGGVMDYSVMLKEKAKIQSGLDGGALAAAAALKSSSKNMTDAQVKARIQKYIDVNLADTGISTKSLEIVRTDTTIAAKLQAEVPTAFLSLLGINTITIKAVSKVEYNFPPLEVALVLDNTGSMDFYGRGFAFCRGHSYCKDKTRMTKLKAAAKKFVTDLQAKVVDDPQSLKIGIVPYSRYVRLDTSFLGADWLDMSNVDTYEVRGECLEWKKKKEKRRRHRRRRKRNRNKICKKWETTTHYDWDGFIGFRANRRNERDDNYNLEKIPAISEDNAPTSIPSSLTSILPLQPLTEAGKTRLLNKIDEMQPDGGTYIPGGLIWGARMLSPQAPLDEGMSYDDQKTRKARKVIVLMTDGVNTCSPYRDHYVSCRSGLDINGLNSMTRICNNLKQINPDTGKPYADIMTIGFELDELSAYGKALVESRLRDCATLGYYPATRDNIADIFGKVGMKLSQLHISQ